MKSIYRSTSGKTNYALLGLIVFILIAISSAGYFTVTNNSSSMGYEITSYQKKNKKLEEDNQRMKIIIADEASFKKINENNRAEKMNLVSIADQRYLVISSSSMASR